MAPKTAKCVNIFCWHYGLLVIRKVAPLINLEGELYHLQKKSFLLGTTFGAFLWRVCLL